MFILKVMFQKLRSFATEILYTIEVVLTVLDCMFFSLFLESTKICSIILFVYRKEENKISLLYVL